MNSGPARLQSPHYNPLNSSENQLIENPYYRSKDFLEHTLLDSNKA